MTPITTGLRQPAPAVSVSAPAGTDGERCQVSRTEVRGRRAGVVHGTFSPDWHSGMFVNCFGSTDASPEDTDCWQPAVLDPAKLVERLAESGLIGRRVRAVVAGRNPAPREEYEAAWFYSRVAAARRGESL